MMPQHINHWKSQIFDAEGWLVTDQLINGACGGGTFMQQNASLSEVSELAQNMTLKNQLNEIPFGGAKAGIRFNPQHPDSLAVLTEFLQYCEPQLKQSWGTGADLNTDAAVIEKIVQGMGLDSAFYALGQMHAEKLGIPNQCSKLADRVTLPINKYFNLEKSAVGYSITELMKHVSQQRLRIILQGFGKIGNSLAYYLHQSGIADIINIVDHSGYIACETGIDIEQLIQLRVENPNFNTLEQLYPLYISSDATQWQPADPTNIRVHWHSALREHKANCIALCANRYAINAELLDVIQNHTFSDSETNYILAGANLPFTNLALRDQATAQGIIVFPSWLTSAGNSLLYSQALSVESPDDNWPMKTLNKISAILIEQGMRHLDFYQKTDTAKRRA